MLHSVCWGCGAVDTAEVDGPRSASAHHSVTGGARCSRCGGNWFVWVNRWQLDDVTAHGELTGGG